jgi:hypothetical protein
MVHEISKLKYIFFYKNISILQIHLVLFHTTKPKIRRLNSIMKAFIAYPMDFEDIANLSFLYNHTLIQKI